MQNNTHTKVKLTSLAENKFLRYFNFIALYFAQGIPEGMLTFGIPAWLAMNGKSPGEIAGFVAIAVLPWSFKFIVAPLMDRHTYLPMGRKRPWIIIGQLGLIISCIYMAYIPDPLNNLDMMMVAAFIISFFGAFQDVATDGLAVDIIPAEQQAKANGLMWGSKVIGMSASLAIGSWIINTYDFTSAMLVMATGIGIIMFVPVFLRERPGEKLLPWAKGTAPPTTIQMQLESWKLIFTSLYSIFKLRNSLLIALLLLISSGAFKYLATLMPIFTVNELGWTNVEYSNYFASAKLIGGISGMLIGGILIDKFGKKRMLYVYYFCAIILISSLVGLQMNWGNKNLIFACMILENILYTFVSIAVFAVAMQCCWKKISASQFTLFMTIGNIGQMVFAGIIGPIREHFNWNISLLAFGIFIGLTLCVLFVINLDKHIAIVAEFDNKDADGKVLEMAAN